MALPNSQDGDEPKMPVLRAEQNIASNNLNQSNDGSNNGQLLKKNIKKNEDDLEMVDEIVRRISYDVHIVQLGRCKARCLFVEVHEQGIFLKRLYNPKLSFINKFNTDIGSDDFSLTMSKFGEDYNPNVLRGVYLFIDLQPEAAAKISDPLQLSHEDHGFGRSKLLLFIVC